MSSGQRVPVVGAREDGGSRARGSIALAHGLLLFTLLACGPTAEAPSEWGVDLAPGRFAGRNLILISVDTLRADHMGLYGYERDTTPFVDALAKQAIVFDGAQAPRGLTWPSLVAMHTGLTPRGSNVRRNGDLLADDVPTLGSILRERGYQTGAFMANACDAFRRDLDRRVCGRDEKLTSKAIDWLRKSHPEPVFAWIHYYAPHEPYSPPDEFDVFSDPGYAGNAKGTRGYLDRRMLAKRPLAPADHQHVIDLYDGEIRRTDAAIREVWQALEETGLLESSIVVLTSDHGEELAQHRGYYYHACSIYDAVLHVPLLVWLPDGPRGGARFSQLVTLMDLAPTLLELLGAPVPEAVEGRSLLPLLRGDPGASERFVEAIAEYVPHSLTGEMTSLRTDRWRYVHNPDELVAECKPKGDYFDVAAAELYDRDADPGELRNVAGDHPEVLADLRERLLEAWAAGPEVRAPLRADPETLERLKALGYLGDDS